MTWNTPAASDGAVTHYTLIVQSPDDPAFFRQIELEDPTAVQYVVTPVRPASNYECCLTVRTSLGDSPFSCSSAVTDEDGKCVRG